MGKEQRTSRAPAGTARARPSRAVVSAAGVLARVAAWVRAGAKRVQVAGVLAWLTPGTDEARARGVREAVGTNEARAKGAWRAAVVAAIAVLVAGCGSGAGAGSGAGGSASGQAGGNGSERGGQGSGGQGEGVGFNGTDVAWIQLMVAMDEQMVVLAVRVTERLGERMGTVRSGHETELKQLKELRKRAGMSEANPHAGHTMPGLVTQEDIAHADDERRVIERVVEHFEQRILLARGVGSSGTQLGVKTLATAIERGSIDALASWRALSKEWVPSVHPSKEI